jgi:hypothetical protein
MTFNKRLIPILFLLAAAPGLIAQTPASSTVTATAKPATDGAATTTTATAAPAEESRSSNDTRNQFNEQLRHAPPEVATILALDPTLLSDDTFLARYPQLARYVAAHPEVRYNPRFYLSDFDGPRHQRSPLDELIESASIFCVFTLVAFVLAWLVRTVIEQKRWNRLSRTQSEVHNKILDRFGNTEELLAYIRTPAGSKFLESAPIPLHSEPQGAPQNAGVTRAMWSIQIGVIVAAAAIGMLIVSGRVDKESAEGFYALGVIALCVGGGFIVSAAVSLLLSRRLGIWQAPAGTDIAPADS